MTTTKQQFTISDVAALPDDGCRYDLIRGELIRMSPATGEHGAIAGELARLIGNVVKPQGRGRVYIAKAGFILARDPDVLLCPEVSYVSADRLGPLPEQREFMELAPNLVVEVMSPSNTLRDIRTKVDAYLDGGVQAVWVVDPVRLSVTVHLAGGEVEILSEDDTLDGVDVLPDFSVPVSQIFE